MKHVLPRLLVLFLLVTLLPVSVAQAGSNGINFMYNLLPMTITSVTENDNGTVTMTWSDPHNNGPYKAYYEPVISSTRNFCWFYESRSKSFTFGWLAPGVEYELYVMDSDGNASNRYTFTPRSYVNNRHGTSISIQPYLGGKTCSRFSKTTLTKQLNSSQISMTMKVNYSRLAYPRSYRYRVVVTAPNGFAHAVWAGDINMPSGRTYWTEKGINLNDYFSILDKYYYGIPTGTYTVTLVYDQEIVCSDTFYVGG